MAERRLRSSCCSALRLHRDPELALGAVTVEYEVGR